MEQLFGSIKSVLKELEPNAKADEAVAFAAWKHWILRSRFCGCVGTTFGTDHELSGTIERATAAALQQCVRLFGTTGLGRSRVGK